MEIDGFQEIIAPDLSEAIGPPPTPRKPQPLRPAPTTIGSRIEHLDLYTGAELVREMGYGTVITTGPRVAYIPAEMVRPEDAEAIQTWADRQMPSIIPQASASDPIITPAPGSQKRIPAPDISAEEIGQMYQDGMTIRQIASRTGRSNSYVRSRVVASGVEMRTRGKAKKAHEI